MKVLKLAFSPCPNDTFIFYAMLHGKIDLEGLEFKYEMADIEELNRRAVSGIPDMVKVSYHTYLFLRDEYSLLDSGSALGFGNGPLLISKEVLSKNDLPGKTVAIPGELTTAHLLLKFFLDDGYVKKIMVFNKIEDAVLNGEVDAGVIIHENRFTYESKGLKKIIDLGEYWQNKTGSPVPLGGIVVRKELGELIYSKLNRIMRLSVEYAFAHPEETMHFVRSNAQEMNEEVMKKHIALFVNKFTVDLGPEGRKAIQILENNGVQFTG